MKLVLCIIFIFISSWCYSQFPEYVELDIGETFSLSNGEKLKLVSKQITCFDSTLNKIGGAEVSVMVNGNEYTIPVGYENEGAVIGEYLVGVEIINDYLQEKERYNKRFRLFKDARLRVSRASEPVYKPGKFIYPLFTPWNSGARYQGWLNTTWLIGVLEGKQPIEIERYHDGWDFGVWEGQLVRSFAAGTVVNPDDYPGLIDMGLLYNKNKAPVGGNPFLVKDPELPVLYYYTHMSGIAKDFHVGDLISKGEIIGYASARGSSGGWYHLHFSIIHLENEYHVNPFPFLKQAYMESMGHYSDFFSEFGIYEKSDEHQTVYQFEKDILNGRHQPIRIFKNPVPGVVYPRDAVAKCPHSGHEEVVFDRYAVFETRFNTTETKGELWFGHTGIARVYLNGELLYSGENKNPYHTKYQPFQWDSEMLKVNFIKGANRIVVAIEQTSPNWSFSIRARDRLGLPL